MSKKKVKKLISTILFRVMKYGNKNNGGKLLF